MIVDREGNPLEEKVYGEGALKVLYARNPFSRFLKNVIARLPLFSRLWGGAQNLPWTRTKVAPFIKKFGLDTTEFEKERFTSFNDFFTRKLKKGARPIEAPICCPADGRYLAFPDVTKMDGIFVKGATFSLEELLQRPCSGGSLVLARLAPVDYHRFHFPLACTPKEAKLINGPLFSVNPLSLRQNIRHLCENKRVVTELETPLGTVYFVEVGATNVGSIHQTYTPRQAVEAGDEKGFFSFGGSALIILFPPGKVELDPHLVAHSKQHIETRCLMGQFLARPL